MPRVTRGYKARRRRKKVLKAARGYRGSRSKLYKTAKETLHRAWCFAYRDRRNKKRHFRRLWITRINAAARQNGMSYSKFMGGLNKANVELDRKVLADLAVFDADGFSQVVQVSRDALS